MPLTRRHFLTHAAVAVGLAPLLPRRAWAATRVSMGSMLIDTLSDGHLVMPGDFILGGMAKDEAQAIRAEYGLPENRLIMPCNVTLLRDGPTAVLFDTGAGTGFQDSAGKLAPAQLGLVFDGLGMMPEDITHVVLTHAHPDHIGGLLDAAGAAAYPNADYMIGQAEFDFWTDPATAGRIGSARAAMAEAIRAQLLALADQLILLQDGQEVLPGVVAHLTSGHTPGHMAFEVRSGSESAMILGDAINNHHVGFARPDWVSGSDMDGEMAATARLRLLDRITAEQMHLTGFHLPGGGIGRAERRGAGYHFIAAG
ncbi:MAG: MBL fold metallo-hydrolase [Paracoccaceae bacterium]|nr:MBL fold metallo-hydrolase [Paracoccaceae bacterium]